MSDYERGFERGAAATLDAVEPELAALRQQVEDLQVLLDSRTDEVVRANDGRKRLAQQVEDLQAAVPSTFYADRPLVERVNRICKAWNMAVRLLDELQDKHDALDQQVEDLTAHVRNLVKIANTSDACPHCCGNGRHYDGCEIDAAARALVASQGDTQP